VSSCYNFSTCHVGVVKLVAVYTIDKIWKCVCIYIYIYIYGCETWSLTLIFRKWEGVVRIGWSWFRIRDTWWALVITVMNFRVPKMRGIP